MAPSCFLFKEKRVVGEDNKLDEMFQKSQSEAVETLMSALSSNFLIFFLCLASLKNNFS